MATDESASVLEREREMMNALIGAWHAMPQRFY